MNKPAGRLYLVGVGPGDPDLMTFRAVKVLEDAPVIAAPKGSSSGASSALAAARAQVDMTGKEVVELHFPMRKVFPDRDMEQDEEVLRGWANAAETVLKFLDQGLDVAFPTIGDPAIYSTAFYLLYTLSRMRQGLDVRVVPGISAMSACSAAMHIPLGLGDELITVVPAAFGVENLASVLETSHTTVLMKVNSRLDALVEVLEESGLVDSAVLIERCGLPGQNIYTDVRKAVGRKLHYFSTMIVRKGGRACGMDIMGGQDG